MAKKLHFEHEFAGGAWKCKITVPDRPPPNGLFVVGVGPNPEMNIEWAGEPFGRGDKTRILEDYRAWMLSVYQTLSDYWHERLHYGLVADDEGTFELYEINPGVPPRRVSINAELN